MAENKTSFVCYASWKESIDALSDKDAGKLFKHILAYVNDENPPEPTGVVLMAWIPIKQQMKRDLKKWEGALEEKSAGGSMGNLKRWHKDLYNQVISKKLTLEEATRAAYHRTPSHTDDMRSHPIASIAVDVDVTDTVNVDVIKNNIDSRKLKFADTLKPFVEKYGREMVNDFYKYWTEPNKSKTKFKQESEKTWEVSLRLETWARNELKFGKGKNSNPKENKLQATFNAGQAAQEYFNNQQKPNE
jgi:hypothetical protein